MHRSGRASPRSPTAAPSRPPTRDVSLSLSPELDTIVSAVDLREAYTHVFADARGQVLADVVGAHRQLAVPAVDENRELHGTWPAEFEQCVECRSYCPPGEQHVVHEHDDLARD